MFQEIKIETMHKKDSYFQKPEKGSSVVHRGRMK